MSVYNWENLSDHDFELVCRDVMAVLVGAPVEAFARGRDGGIDLRSGAGKSLILGQAKHRHRSSYGKLLTEVRQEKLKLDAMASKPAQYLLFTTQSLTPHRKSELAEALQPYCVEVSDIHGVEDIEGIIAAEPKIEEHHFKLWLNSARVLGHILGNATRGRSRIRTDELLERARLFVPHDGMAKAQQILRTERSLIISGQAGIGKTTMAEMLSLRFLAAGYELSFVSNVHDLEKEMREGQKQLFLYDDFLGRTNIRDAPGATDQERLFTFMRFARRVGEKYLILTTREYLYREARVVNDRLAENRADLVKCLLDVAGYSRMNRALILYNHLYWARSIPTEALGDFVVNKSYEKIIGHPEFNPRFIADTINRLAPPGPSMDVEEGLWT
jgi:hypothetical protein